MAADLPGEDHVLPLLFGGLDPGHHLHDLPGLRVTVAILDQEAAPDPLDVPLPRVGRRRFVGEDPDRLLLGEDPERILGVGGGCQYLDEILVKRLGQGSVDLPVDHDHAAEGRERVGRERLLVGLEHPVPDRHPARVVVLDDHAGRLVEVGKDPAGRVEVEHVVERERLAVELRKAGQEVARKADFAVERPTLVGVLAIGEFEQLLVGDHLVLGEVLVGLAEPARDRRVVAGGVGEGLVGKPVTGRG